MRFFNLILAKFREKTTQNELPRPAEAGRGKITSRNLNQPLNLGDIHCVLPFGRICLFERDFVAFFQFFEGYALELVPVEKEIFLFAFNFDESEASVCECFDCSFHGQR